MKITTRLTATALLGLLGSCTINPHPMDMTQAVQTAKTTREHNALARHYEDVARDMQAKADEHKKLLAYYQARKDLVRKQAQDLISHCQGLIRIYDQAATENMEMAQSHRELAAQAK